MSYKQSQVRVSAAHRDQNLNVRDRRTAVTASDSALLHLCQTAVLASGFLPFPVEIAVPNIVCVCMFSGLISRF